MRTASEPATARDVGQQLPASLHLTARCDTCKLKTALQLLASIHHGVKPPLTVRT